MTLIPKEQIFVGLEITPKSFKIAAIKKRGKSWLVPILEEIPRHEEEKLQKLLPKEAILVTTLPSREILIKNLHIPLKDEKEIKAAFEFQVEPLLPYPMDKSLVAYIKTGEKEQGTNLAVFAIKKETFLTHLETWKSFIPYDIDCVTSPLAALCFLSRHFVTPVDPFFLIHIGKEEGNAALIEKGHIISCRFFEKDQSEIEKTLLALSANYKSKQIETIILVAEEPSWQEILQNISGKTVGTPSLKDLPLSDENLQRFGLCIGMALGASSDNFPNFRQKEFQIHFPWRRLKKSLFTLGFLFLTLLSSTIYLSSSYLHKKEQALLEKFGSFFSKKKVKNLSELKDELSAIEKQVRESPDLFPLIPFVPKMIDFISWFSSHPIPVQNEIHIEEVRYHMVKRPDFTKPQERYLVQVEMVFFAPNASSAENIRNLLSAQNPFIDTKKEIQWQVEKGKYKAQFTLKDKTQYY